MSRVLFCILLVCLSIGVGYSQIYFQIEKYNSPKTLKFIEGDFLWIKTYEYPDDWRRLQIEQIMVDEDVIIFDKDMLFLTDIKAIKMVQKPAQHLSVLFNSFGISWFVFAGILHITDRWEFGRDTAIIGGSALTLGYGVKKTFGKKTFKMGKNARVRIIDLRISNVRP